MSRLNYINLVPQEILTGIFTRLPAKSLGLCKYVSKSWNSLISEPYFIKAHLTKTSVTSFVLIPSHWGPLYSVRFDNQNPICNGLASKLRFSCCDKWSRVWGSYDGLVLVEDHCLTKYLLNPATLESKKLPVLPCRFRSVFSLDYNFFVFGYDFSCDDYAVVSMCYRYPSKKEYLNKEFLVYVYLLKKNRWKKIGFSPYDHSVQCFAPGIFVKGSFHWLAKYYNDRDSWLISAFNIANQGFSEVPPPNGVSKIHLLYSKLGVHKGCLYLMANVDVRTELWVMKEYGVVESWIKLSVVLSRYSQLVSLDNLPEDSLVIWKGGKFELHVSNVKKDIKVLSVIKDCMLTEYCTYRVGMTFVDSLVSPNSKDANKKNGARRPKTIKRLK